METTSPFFVALAYVSLFPTRYPDKTVTLKGRDVEAPATLNDFVLTATAIFVVITSTVYVPERVPTFASAVTSTLVPVLSNTKGSFTWKPLPPF